VLFWLIISIKKKVRKQMASSSDKFIKTVQAPPSKLAGPIGPDTETIPLQTLEGWSSTTAVVVAIDRYDDATGELTPSKTEIVVGTLGPNGLENVERGVGGTRQNHSDGAVAEISIAAGEQWNRAMDALIGAFGQDGKLKGEMIVPGSVGPEQITPSSIGPEQLDPVKFPVQYSGGSFSGGNTTLKTFTPKSNGVIFVTAHARRNSATAADINLTLGGSGMTDIRTNAGTGYGTADAHATTSLVAEVTKDTPVSLTMNASGGSVVNTGWTMLVVPGSAELV
jgi:hypothetical protein